MEKYINALITYVGGIVKSGEKQDGVVTAVCIIFDSICFPPAFLGWPHQRLYDYRYVKSNHNHVLMNKPISSVI